MTSKDCAESDIRWPVCAGAFYTSDAEKLIEQIEGFLSSSIGEEDVCGLLVPHAGYVYSGPTAGEAYARLSPGKRIVFLGTNHFIGDAPPFSIYTKGGWASPLGKTDIDEELAGELAGKNPFCSGKAVFAREHSLEVQVPFVQMVDPECRIVPILVSTDDLEQIDEAAGVIAGALAKADSDRRTVIIASTDMTHYESESVARERDAHALRAIEKMDVEGLYRAIDAHEISMCGRAPTALMMAALKKMGKTRSEILAYETSARETGDAESVVGYAAAAVRD